MTKAWFYLSLAGCFEVVWAVSLKYTVGFTKFWPSAGTLAAMLVSILLLAEAYKSIPIGTAYAVWTGIGAAGTAVIGMWLFGESRDLFRLGCILLVVAGIFGLKVSADR